MCCPHQMPVASVFLPLDLQNFSQISASPPHPTALSLLPATVTSIQMVHCLLVQLHLTPGFSPHRDLSKPKTDPVTSEPKTLQWLPMAPFPAFSPSASCHCQSSCPLASIQTCQRASASSPLGPLAYAVLSSQKVCPLGSSPSSDLSCPFPGEALPDTQSHHCTCLPFEALCAYSMSIVSPSGLSSWLGMGSGKGWDLFSFIAMCIILAVCLALSRQSVTICEGDSEWGGLSTFSACLRGRWVLGLPGVASNE